MNYVVSKRMGKKQQMRWSQRGAHLLLQIRTRVLNLIITHNFRELRKRPDGQVGEKKKGAADNKL